MLLLQKNELLMLSIPPVFDLHNSNQRSDRLWLVLKTWSRWGRGFWSEMVRLSIMYVLQLLEAIPGNLAEEVHLHIGDIKLQNLCSAS